MPLGEAFQLRDDMLGIFGDPRETGKPAGDDIRDGKRTLLIARAYDRASKTQRKVLDANVGQSRIDARGTAAVQLVLHETGAVAAVETVIDELTSAALAALAKAPIDDPEACRALEVLTDRATYRLL